MDLAGKVYEEAAKAHQAENAEEVSGEPVEENESADAQEAKYEEK